MATQGSPTPHAKTNIRLATLYGSTTVTALRTNLSELTQYAMKQNSNIDQLPSYYNQNYAQLEGQGQSVDNVHTILVNTFLLGMLDNTFHDYIRMLQDNLMDQRGGMHNATHEDIMKKAKTNTTYWLTVASGEQNNRIRKRSLH